MVSVQAAPTPSRAIHLGDIKPDERAIWVLLIGQAGAFVTQVLAVFIARRAAVDAAMMVSVCAYGLAFASALWVLTRSHLTRTLRNTAVVCLAVTTVVLRWLPNPLMFTQYDEQLHVRTLSDIVSSHGLFQPHPLLGVSPRYPGLESVAAFFHQLGLPVMVASMAVVLVARVALALVLCDTVEQLTGSPRAGGLAVAVYSVSAHFIAFMSMFSYQTLALPLALAAVALIARARWAADPRSLFAGATVCLLAVAVTHHVTSWVTAAFLVVWATAEAGQARRRIFYGAAVAVSATTAWALIQWSLVRDYFAPMINDLGSQLSGRWTRGAFRDTAGFSTPVWERALLVYWAGAVTLVVSLLIWLYARSVLPRLRIGAPRGDTRRWEPRVLLVALVAMIPVFLAGRALPEWGEVGDRLGSFLFLALSLLVAGATDRWSQLRRGSNFQSWSHRQLVIARSLALVLATGVFVGGYLMGSGPAWSRLPGPYLVCADGRSMDAETLAAVHWAHDELRPGSRIGGDRVSTLLLAGQAGLWPVLDKGNDGVPSLYYADEWGRSESELARALHLRYLYIDRRLADDLPHVDSYFYDKNKTKPPQLTRAELTKFENVRGIQTVYRHGPISIYDLTGLGVQEDRSGWVGEERAGWIGVKDPAIRVPIELAIGLLAGLVLALVARSNAGYFVAEKIKSFQVTAGPYLTFATGLATLCGASVLLLLGHIWFGPVIFLSMALGVLLVNRRSAKFWAKFLLVNGAARLRRRWTVFGILVVALVAATAQSILGAYLEDITNVQSILHDPSAVHNPDPAGSG
jgi:hypothetical protein